MYHHRETNPHFIELEIPQRPQRQQASSSPYHFPTETQPQAPPPQLPAKTPKTRRGSTQTPDTHHGSLPLSTPQHTAQTPETHRGSTPLLMPQTPETPSHPTTPHSPTEQLNRHGLPYHREPSALRVPLRRKATPFAWLVAAFCALFWIIIIVGGLLVLIIYLAYRPRSPKFDITGASLNAAYLDTGYLLNGDLTLLANFTNANKKVAIDFSYVVMDLYFAGYFIATTYVEPLSVMSRQSRFANAHFTPSQVPLSLGLSQELQRQMDSGRVRLEIRGLIKAKSKLGGIFKYSYWLKSRCDIIVVSPPDGVLLGHRCVTKR